MKKIILISVLLNLGLIAAVGYKFRPHPASAPSDSETTVTPLAEKETAANKKSNTPTKSVASATAAARIKETKFTWHEVESEDYKKYIANLRSIHCPEETIRDIIFADVNKFYTAKLAPYRKPKDQTGYQYWKNGNWYGNQESDEYYKMSRQFDKEKRDLIKELLGVDYLKALAERSPWPQSSEKSDLLENMPQEKKDKVQEIDSRYNDLRQAFYKKTRGYQDEDDQAELRKMEKQKHDELAKIMTPEELFEREVRSSDLANNLKWNELRAFDASEEEFRAIFKARQTADLAITDDQSNDKTEWEKRRKAQQQAQDDLKSVMSEDRLKDFKLAQDWEYSHLVEIAQRNGGSKETAKSIYDMKAEIEKVTRDIRGDRSLTPEQRTEKLQLVQAATEKTITELLGPKGFKSFKRNAWWLRDMVPRTIVRSK
jgi:hypothetical protein